MKLSTKALFAAGTLALASTAMADQAYDAAVDSANGNYELTVTGCRSLSGDERRTCYNEARADRLQAMRQARDQSSATVIVYPAAADYPVHIVTPADRTDIQLSNPNSRTMDDPTP